jgi:hypothetical protein
VRHGAIGVDGCGPGGPEADPEYRAEPEPLQLPLFPAGASMYRHPLEGHAVVPSRGRSVTTGLALLVPGLGLLARGLVLSPTVRTNRGWSDEFEPS